MIDATCSYLLPSMPSREKQTSPMKYMMCVKHLLSWKKQQSFDLTLVSSSLLLIICCQYIYLWISTSYKYCDSRNLRDYFLFFKTSSENQFCKKSRSNFPPIEETIDRLLCPISSCNSDEVRSTTSFRFNRVPPILSTTGQQAQVNFMELLFREVAGRHKRYRQIIWCLGLLNKIPTGHFPVFGLL
jgi:hypothetical protein